MKNKANDMKKEVNNMKKFFSTLLAGLILFSLAACQNASPANDEEQHPALDMSSSNTPENSYAATNNIGSPASVGKNIEVANNSFDLERRTVMLNIGISMPILGIGTYALSDSEAQDSVYWALRDGYRLIDTARIYGDEAGVGRGIQRAIDEGIATREEIFVTTKMWTSDYDNADAAINASLDRLGLDYVDLMILHHSQPANDVSAYKAMERAVKDGRLRAIGLSNYYDPDDFDRIVNSTSILPAVLQNETHPYHQSADMKEHIAKYGTVLESWFPLGGRTNTQTLLNDPVICAIADARGKTSAQIILRWHLQDGHIAIPGSHNETHIRENFDVFDFELRPEEMNQIAALNKNERLGYW